jgi:RNA recognition motif-containing protein
MINGVCKSTVKEGKPDNSGDNCNLVVKGVPHEWNNQDLETYFKNYGPVRSVKIAKD